MKRKLKSPTISLDLCIYLGVEPSCLCMRWPVWERLKSGCICAQSLSHQIFQARILEQAAISFSGESSLPRSNLHLLCLLHWQVGSSPPSHLESPLYGYYWDISEGVGRQNRQRDRAQGTEKEAVRQFLQPQMHQFPTLAFQNQVSAGHSQHPAPSRFGPPVYLTKGPPCLWRLKSESCLIHHSPFHSKASYLCPCLLGHSSFTLQAPGCWWLPGLGPLPHLDIWN